MAIFIGWLTCIPAVLLTHSFVSPWRDSEATVILRMSIASVVSGKFNEQNNRNNKNEMTDCKLQITECKNLILRTAKTGQFEGQKFFGCKNYPECSYQIPLHFDENVMTEQQQKLASAFGLFVRSNCFIYATYGVLYFNLRKAAFMDYLLRIDVVYSDANVETGLTGAKIYNSLFFHLFLIPTAEIKRYLINNFPKTYTNLSTKDFTTKIFSNGIDYDNHKLDEDVFRQYSDIETYNR